MRGGSIGVVEESRNSNFAVGDHVSGLLGWQDYAVVDGSGVGKLPQIPGLPMTAHLGLFGHIGLTAYYGLLDVGQPKAGETLVVSAAAGAVGSLVGQIGKIVGCRVVGIAGSDEKCGWLTGDLGFDAAINYKNENIAEALKRNCPNGIDVDFENVGGEVFDAVLARMNQFGRVALCGLISAYNATEPPPAPRNLRFVLTMRLKVQGFIVFDFAKQYKEATSALLGWYRDGRLKLREDVRDGGLDAFPTVLRQLYTGGNFGKLVLKA
jgi:NADPH-dependent curcumin reductase CurA